MSVFYSTQKLIIGCGLFFVSLVSAFPIMAQLSLSKADETLLKLHENPYQDVDLAIGLCDQLTSIYENSKDTCKWIRAISQRSAYETTGDNYKKALASNIEAQKLYENSSCDQEVLAFIYYSYARFYAAIDENKKSDSITRLAIDIYQPHWEDQVTLIKLYFRLGSGDGPIEEVMPYLDTAYNLAKANKNVFQEQRALINIGTTYAIEGNQVEAFRYLNSALEIAKKRNATRELGILYNNLAGLSEKSDEILRYIDSALYYAKLSDDLEDVQLFTENQAYFYSTIGMYDSAYQKLYSSVELKDSLFNIQKFEAIAEMSEKYAAEKKSNEIQALKVDNLKSEVQNLNYKRNQIRLVWGAGVLLVLLGFFAYNLVVIRRNRNALAVKNEAISMAQQRSDELLLNILPEEIALELKENGKADARDFELVSILFTDFKEFTKTSENMSTTELVEELNYCFEGFDKITEKYKIEKIKTIGDSFMAAGGLPIPFEDSVKNTVLAALEMQDYINERRVAREAQGKPHFEMRVGIHSGPVVAGIVGVKKFQYDLWGDTVNTASRLETSGEVRKVNISQSTYNLLSADPDLSFEPRGKVKAKGKGEIDMFFVTLANQS